MIHEQLKKALDTRLEDRHLNQIAEEAERKFAARTGMIEMSPSEALALVGEVMEIRRNKVPPVPSSCLQLECARCDGFIVYEFNVDNKRYERLWDDEEDTCKCAEGKEQPCCNCGVSRGLRSDHESQCAAAYIRR